VETGCQGGQGSPRAVAPNEEEGKYCIVCKFRICAQENNVTLCSLSHFLGNGIIFTMHFTNYVRFEVFTAVAMKNAVFGMLRHGSCKNR
jgi:hypothetical protein